MANEIQIGASIQAAKNGTSISGNATGVNLTMAGNLTNKVVQLISHTAWTALSLGTVSGVPTAMLVKNLDPANFVSIAIDNAGANKFCQLPKGAAVPLLPPAAVSFWLKADTADVYVETNIAE
jgi:hypothetical protein